MSRKRNRSKKEGSLPEIFPSWLAYRPAAAACAVGWTAVCFYAYYKRGVELKAQPFLSFLELLPTLGGHLVSGLGRNLLLLGGLVFLAERLGSLIFKLLRYPNSAQILIRIALGSGFLSLLLLISGLAGFWSPTTLRVYFYAGLAGAVGHWIWKRLKSADTEPDSEPHKKARLGILEWAACVLIAATLALNLLASVVPEIFYDSLVYHLAIPQLYLYRGAIVPTPENVYSGLPFALQMLYGWGLALSGENLAVLIHGAFGIATALCLFSLCRRYATPRAGVYAVLLFYVCPISVYAGWHCGVDLGAAFYVLAAFSAMMRSFEEREDAEVHLWDAAAGLLAGFAMSVKYNVWPVAAVMTAGHFVLSARSGRSFKGSVRMAACAALVLAPWLIKNAVFFGNPIYPFLHEHIGRVRPVDWGGFLDAAGSRDLKEIFAGWSGFRDFLLIPWNYSMADRPTDDWPGPAFILLTVWAAILKWKSPDGKGTKPIWVALPVLAAAAYGFWVISSSIVRYALVAIPLFSLAGAWALEYGDYPKWVRVLGRTAVLLACVFNFQISYRLGNLTGQWKHVKAGWDKAYFLKFQRMSYGLPYYAAMEHIGKNTPKDAKILFLGESRAFYCPRDFIAATLYDTNPFWRIVAESETGEEVYRKVRSLGVSHIFLSARQMLYRRASPSIFPQDLVKSEVFGDFWERYLTREFEDREDGGTDPRWMTVYALKEPGEGPRLVAENPARIILEFLEKEKAGAI